MAYLRCRRVGLASGSARSRRPGYGPRVRASRQLLRVGAQTRTVKCRKASIPWMRPFGWRKVSGFQDDEALERGAVEAAIAGQQALGPRCRMNTDEQVRQEAPT